MFQDFEVFLAHLDVQLCFAVGQKGSSYECSFDIPDDYFSWIDTSFNIGETNMIPIFSANRVACKHPNLLRQFQLGVSYKQLLMKSNSRFLISGF